MVATAFADRRDTTTGRMAKKSSEERRKTPRLPVMMSREWYDVARKLASSRHQPITWLVASLIEEAARKAKIEPLPKLPWDEDLEVE